MQQFIFIYSVFGQFLTFRFSFGKSWCENRLKALRLQEQVPSSSRHCCLSCIMLRAAWLTILLTLSEEAASNILNKSLLFCSKYTFQKVGSRSPLCNVCYVKNAKAPQRTNPFTLNTSFSTEKPGYPFVYRLLAWTNAGKHRKPRISPPLQSWAHIRAENEKNTSEYGLTGYNRLPSYLNWIEFDL